jgi:hypothetical protein
LGLGWPGIAKLLNDERADGGYGRDGWWDVKDGNMSSRYRRIVRLMRPGIGCVGLGVAVEIEDFHNPIPHCLTLEDLFDGHTFTMSSLRTVETVNRLAKLVDIIDIHFHKRPSRKFRKQNMKTPAA